MPKKSTAKDCRTLKNTGHSPAISQSSHILLFKSSMLSKENRTKRGAGQFKYIHCLLIYHLLTVYIFIISYGPFLRSFLHSRCNAYIIMFFGCTNCTSTAFLDSMSFSFILKLQIQKKLGILF